MANTSLGFGIYVPAPSLRDKPGHWLGCNLCGALVGDDPAQGTLAHLSEAGLDSTQLLRWAWLRGWTGTAEELLCPLHSITTGAPPAPAIQEFTEQRPAVNPTYKAVLNAVEVYQQDNSWQNAHAAILAAGTHIKSGTCTQAEICPTAAVIYALLREWPYTNLLGRIFRLSVTVVIWVGRNVYMRGRPGWNDFEMMCWQLTRDPYYVQRIRKQHDTTKGMVAATCSWMVESVRAQDPEFDRQWREEVARG